MKITSLILKNNRVQIFIDEKYAFSATQNFVVNNYLFKDKELEAEQFEELKRKAQYSIVEYKLFEYASRLAHSPKELRTKIANYCQKRFDFTPDEDFYKKAFEKVESLHLYDVNVVIQNLIKKYLGRSKSKNYIRSKLISKGFEKNLIDEKLTQLDTKQIKNNLERILEKKLNSIDKTKFKSNFELRQKLTQFAAQKGFGFSEIKSVLDKLLN